METPIDNIEISVILLTFNHASTVEDSLKSIFSQKVNVPFEVLCLDDASTDGTQDILRKYAQLYPDVVKLHVREHNSGYVTKIMYDIRKDHSRGKYWAVIEGDDCWIDDGKLQRQYDFLESHPEFIAVMSDVLVIDEDGNEKDLVPYVKKDDHIFTLDDYKDLSCPGMGVSGMVRNLFRLGIDSPLPYIADRMMGDMAWDAILLVHGDIYQMPEKTATYRHVVKDGGTNFNSLRQNNVFMDLRFLRYWIRIENYLHKETDGKYRLELIDPSIKRAGKTYSWKDLYHAIKETWDKKRIRSAFWNKFIIETDRLYIKNENVRSRRKWGKFWRDRKPVILFGAGEIAREYLDTYSWRRSVLFIVDNDKTKAWRSYKGYVVKPPEEIMHFAKEAVVLIVNEKYEDVIERQLLDMGIDDYYCYCTMQAGRVKNKLAKKYR